jgi:L-lactate dehydrogenase complex protein LldG
MGREEVLRAVRSALGKQTKGEPVGLEGSKELVQGGPSEDLLALFCLELESAGGFYLEGGADPLDVVSSWMREEGLEGVYATQQGKRVLPGLSWVDVDAAKIGPGSVLGLACATHAVASSGSLVVEGGDLLPLVLTETVLVVLRPDDVVGRLGELPEPTGRRLVVTGPARTADIEKKIVLGAHGPKRVGVLLVSRNEDKAE